MDGKYNRNTCLHFLYNHIQKLSANIIIYR